VPSEFTVDSAETTPHIEALPAIARHCRAKHLHAAYQEA
jgi:hypothetical protein